MNLLASPVTRAEFEMLAGPVGRALARLDALTEELANLRAELAAEKQGQKRESQLGRRRQYRRAHCCLGYRHHRGARHLQPALSGRTANLHDTLSRRFDILDLGRYQGR
jgi:hypothetical protein